MPAPVVWIISAEQWPRAMLRAELIEQGYDAIGVLSLADALTKLGYRPAESPEVVILDLNDAKISRSQLFMLAQQAIPTLVLGGAAELNDPALKEFSWASTLRRPFSVADIVAAVAQIIPKEPLSHQKKD